MLYWWESKGVIRAFLVARPPEEKYYKKESRYYNDEERKNRRPSKPESGKAASRRKRFPHGIGRKSKGGQSRRRSGSLNADLSVAYTLKGQLVELWERDDEDEALNILADWIADAEWSEIPEMLDFVNTLRNHWLKIINDHYCQITTGPLEGLNNKIKTLKRQSYGFRDLEYFKLRILAIHRARYTFVG